VRVYSGLKIILVCLGVTVCAGLATRAAAGPAADLLQAESTALGDGASSLWRAQDIGGSDIGGKTSVERSGPRNMGQKLKAGFLSLLLPGAGQLYNGDRSKALLFGGAEAAVWTSYLVFHYQAYMTSDEYNESIERLARAEQVAATGLITADEGWFWRSERFRENYQILRADANRAYDRRDFTVLFALINRAVAVYDAVRGAGDDQHMLKLAGLGFDVESRRVIGHRGTACVFTRSF